jgi:hypothetical protein
MIDLVQLQKDLFTLLLSAPALQPVNIVREQALMASQVELDAIWQTPRGGYSGNGVLIEEIKAKINSPSIGAQDLEISCVAFQNGDAAFTPITGSGFFAQNLAQVVIDLLNKQAIGGIGTLQAVGTEAAKDYDFISATRATLRIVGANNIQTPRCAVIAYTNNANSVTLTCATPGAVIYYTLDGSAPCNPALVQSIPDLAGNFPAVNSAAVQYAAPFAVTSGDRLRAVAFCASFNPSEILLKTIP